MKSDGLEALSSSNQKRVDDAVRKLVRLRTGGLVPKLLELAVGKNFSAACAALAVLASFGELDVIGKFLIAKLDSHDSEERERAAFALKDLPHIKAYSALLKCAAKDSNIGVRVWAMHALRRLAETNPGLSKGLRPLLMRAVRSKIPQLRHAAYEGVFSLPGRKPRELLLRARRDSNPLIAKVSALDWELSLSQRPRKPG